MAGEEPNRHLIRKDYTDEPALDYNFLRKKAIELIQKFSGRNWTDFNIYDPGITILELLCYAITDLAYRTGFPITDLLADEQGEISEKEHSFIPGNRILSSAPVSENDIRKLLIDEIQGLNNVWLKPVSSDFAFIHIRGAYGVIIQIDAWLQQNADSDEKKKELEETIIQNVKSVLAAHRNMAEDFIEFIILQPQKIEVTAEIVISKNAIPEELLAQVYFRIEQALNPRTVFLAEQELLAEGNKIENIYKGPLLTHGIIPDNELKEIQKEVDKSGLIRSVSDMTDVIHIRFLRLKDKDATTYSDEPVKLKENHYPLLSFNRSFPNIILYYEKLPVPVKTPVFYRMLQRLHDTFRNDFISDVHRANKRKKEEGVYRNVQEYVSLQNLFPAIYRIGSDGIENNASPLRKAQAKQLKGYLLFFEQILANYASQLGNLNHLFSPDIQSFGAQTYFFQPLYQVPEVAPLLTAFTEQPNRLWDTFIQDEENKYLKGLQDFTELDETYNDRKNKVLDHLLSRFNVVPDNYPVVLYKQLYQSQAEGREDEELKWKSALLSQIKDFTYYRMRAENYYKPNQEHLQPGFSLNMRRLLHIQNTQERLSNAVTTHLKRSGKTATPSYPLSQQELQTIEYNNEELIIVKEKEHELSSFHFPQRSVKFFEWGIDISNYRIVPDKEKPEWLVLYKNQTEQPWRIVRRFGTKKLAQEGVVQLIKTLRDASLQSEGFYVVEHLLLAPPLMANVFGFMFYDVERKPLLQQAQWMSFQQRENTIQEIINLVTSIKEDEPHTQVVKLQNLCKMVLPDDKDERTSLWPNRFQHEDNFLQHLLKIKNHIQLFQAERKNRYYPSFHYTVLHWDGSIINETFYDNKVTIVLPSWPLRFQHEGFRQFTETLFQNHLSLHISVEFLWLNISKMIHFETMFFNWKDALQNTNPNARRMESIRLVPFLQNELKQGKS